MQLNNSQKKYIKKHIHSSSIQTIAKMLGVSESTVQLYIETKQHDSPESHEQAAATEGFSLSMYWLKKQKLIFFILFALVLISYVDSLTNAFVSDDRGIVINAPHIDYVFAQPIAFLRPSLYFLFYSIGGMNPFLFHVFDVLLHMGSAFLVYILVYKIAKQSVAIFTACLFAVHPILIEAVTWISGGIYGQYSFFFLLSLVLYIFSKGSKRFYYFSLVSYFLSLVSSEKAVVLFLLFFAYEFCFDSLKLHWKKIVPFATVSIFFALIYLSRLSSRVASLQLETSGDAVAQNPFLQIPVAVTSYILLILWPKDLTIYHSELTFTQMEYIARLLLLIGIGIFYIYTMIKNRTLFFWMSFFFVPLFPTLAPFSISWVVAERYVYLSTVGVFAIIGYGIKKIADRKAVKTTVHILFVFLVIALLVRSIIRNVDWRSEDTLWLATAKASPSSAQNHNNLGDLYGRHGDIPRAISEFKRAIEIKPNYADAYHNLANTYQQIGQYDNAIADYKKALEFNPNIWQSYQNLAAIYFAKGDIASAYANMQKAVALNPTDSNLQVALGVVYLKMGKKDKAKESFTKALQIDPSNGQAQQGLSQVEKQ